MMGDCGAVVFKHHKVTKHFLYLDKKLYIKEKYKFNLYSLQYKHIKYAYTVISYSSSFQWHNAQW